MTVKKNTFSLAILIFQIKNFKLGNTPTNDHQIS